MNPVDITAILPELILIGVGALLVLADAFLPRSRASFPGVACAASLVALCARWLGALPGSVWSGALRVDELGRYVDTYILVALVLVSLLADPYLKRTNARFGEFYGLLLWAATGAMALAKADHFLAFFVGLELLSISLYILNAFHRSSGVSLEAGWKYLVVGAFASAILLFGIALLYGATGALSFSGIVTTLATPNTSPLLLVGLALVLVGIGFKLAVFPFHAWAPDVYQGSPTPVTAFLSVVPKGAMLVVLGRLVISTVPASVAPRWIGLLAAIAIASQVLGNLVAIAQNDLKRMLAYSGIAHMGYALVGVAAFGFDGATALLVYLAAYTFMNIAAFSVISAFSENEEEIHQLADLAGQGWKRPFLSAILALSMFSLAGIPPTVGFVAKFLVFRAAVDQGLVWLAVIGVINSLVSVFFYLRVVYYLYMKPLPKREPGFSEPWPTRMAAALCALAILVLGILPGYLIKGAEIAARLLTR